MSTITRTVLTDNTHMYVCAQNRSFYFISYNIKKERQQDIEQKENKKEIIRNQNAIDLETYKNHMNGWGRIMITRT